MIEAKALARTTDPETSKESAKKIIPRLAYLHIEALGAVTSMPGRTATELVLNRRLNDPRRYNRRLGELEAMGKVLRGPARRCTVTGRRAATWYPVVATEGEDE